MYYAKHDKFIIEDNQVHTTDFLPLKKKYKNMEFLGIFKEIVTMFEIDTYMELGVRKGYTFNNIAPLVKSAVAVDIGDMKNIIELPNVTKIQMRTDDLALKWNEPIDFLFIETIIAITMPFIINFFYVRKFISITCSYTMIQ